MRGEEGKFQDDSGGACSDKLELGELSETDPRPSHNHILRGLT